MVSPRVRGRRPAHRAGGTGLPKHIQQALDLANVEQVFCGSKREDADRKIVDKLHMWAGLLPPKRTVYVVVSSDADFISAYRRLRASGARVVVLHTADTDGGRLAQGLALHTDEQYEWDHVLAGLPIEALEPFSRGDHPHRGGHKRKKKKRPPREASS